MAKAKTTAKPAARRSPSTTTTDAAVSMSATKDELVKVAKQAGVPIETDDNKADLVRKINTQDQFDDADARAMRAVRGF